MWLLGTKLLFSARALGHLSSCTYLLYNHRRTPTVAGLELTAILLPQSPQRSGITSMSLHNQPRKNNFRAAWYAKNVAISVEIMLDDETEATEKDWAAEVIRPVC